MSNSQLIQYEADFSKNAIEGITKKLPNIVLGTAFILGLVIFTIIASHEILSFAKYSYWLAGATFVIILFFDIIFTLSSVVTAIFLKVKSYFYAGLFFTLTVFGFAFTIWRSLEFAKAMKIQEEEVEFALKIILVFACILRAIFSEGGAFMLFAFSFKEEAKPETSETEIAKNKPKQGENNDFAILEKEIQAKVEKLTLPDSIEKIGTDSYCIDYGKAKTYETIAGNMRANRSKYKGFLKEKDVDKAANTKSLENYYQEILDIIESENSKTDSNWEFFPNGTLKKEKVRPINGHKKEPDFFEKETI